ncbi:MAG TPA: TetR/AcrR family transcriptional regulator [Candidatus Acidoferrales bacterium]|nr:TetR/AcrR family transcriptional regulator [Candidatus Acidoferrales bacterium]
MPSHSLAGQRRIPQQKRGRERVAGFLRAAARVINEVGYDRATTSAIAERSNSCIGSLYQFFPNKPSIAEAIRAQHIAEIQQSWIVLGRRAAGLSAETLALELVKLQIEIVRNHPVLLALLDAPATVRTPTRRRLIRGRIADVLMAHKPRMSNVAALRIASVVQQVSRGLLTLYAHADAGEKAHVIEEFEAVLIGYLVRKLK